MTTTSPPSERSQKATPHNYEYISHSAFSDLSRCGELYRLNKIERVDSAPAVYLAGGTAFHTSADAIDYAIIESQRVPF